MHRPQFVSIVLFLLGVLIGTVVAAEPPIGGGGRIPGVVASDHPLASEAGAEILRLGGNAVDAAVATSLALSVVRPDSCGIGGGGFMLIHLADDPRHGTRTIAIDYRETCPAGIAPDSFERWGDPEASRFGGRAVGVPGTVAGLLHALERYGTLDRSVVFAPAIRLAEDGFGADEFHVRTARELTPRFRDEPAWAARFDFVWERMLGQGRVEIGNRIVNPEQARALRRISELGLAGFYDGPTAEAIVESVARDGGVISRADLAGYRVRELEPLRVNWRGRTMLLMPPPSSGGVAMAQMFALGERVGLAFDPGGWASPEQAHLFAEISRHAFADRSRHLGDPDFHAVPIGAMLDPAALDAAAARIDRARASRAGDAGVAPLPEDGGTSHLSVVDSRGNAVACTETINLAFGSLLAVEGFCLNNQMDDFTTVRGEPNAFGLRQSEVNLPEPGKRPLSSMSPTIVLDDGGRVLAVAGASGGPRIISATAQVLWRVVEGGEDPESAVRAPRLHHQWSPDAVYFETWGEIGLTDRVRAGLEAMGHELRARLDIGAVQIIARAPDGSWRAASDPRKGGRPAFEEHDLGTPARP